MTTYDPRFSVGSGAAAPTRTITAPATANADPGVDVGRIGLLALVSAFVVFTVWGTDSALTLGGFLFFVAVSAWSVLGFGRPPNAGEPTIADMGVAQRGSDDSCDVSSPTATVPITEQDVA